MTLCARVASWEQGLSTFEVAGKGHITGKPHPLPLSPPHPQPLSVSVSPLSLSSPLSPPPPSPLSRSPSPALETHPVAGLEPHSVRLTARVSKWRHLSLSSFWRHMLSAHPSPRLVGAHTDSERPSNNRPPLQRSSISQCSKRNRMWLHSGGLLQSGSLSVGVRA